MGLPPKVLRKGITDMVRISDARMSGTAYGTVILHAAPEAARGGPLAIVRTGDMIEIDVDGPPPPPRRARGRDRGAPRRVAAARGAARRRLRAALPRSRHGRGHGRRHGLPRRLPGPRRRAGEPLMAIYSGIWPVAPTPFHAGRHGRLRRDEARHRLHGRSGLRRHLHPRQLLRTVPPDRRGAAAADRAVARAHGRAAFP